MSNLMPQLAEEQSTADEAIICHALQHNLASDKAAIVSSTQAMSNLLLHLSEEPSKADEESICNALQHYLSKIEEVSRREDGRQKIADGQTPVEEEMISPNLQNDPATLKAHAARKLADIRVGRPVDRLKLIDSFGMEFDYHGQTPYEEAMIPQGLQNYPVRVKAHAVLKLADISMGKTVDRLKCIDSFGMEFDYHVQTPYEGDIIAQDLQGFPARVKADALLNLADIQVGKSGDRLKCIDSFGMEFDYHAVTSRRVSVGNAILEKTLDGHLHDTELQSPCREPDPTLNSDPRLIQYFPIMSFKTYWYADLESESEAVRHEIEAAFEKCRADKRETKSCRRARWATSGKHFMKRTREQGRDCDDLTDAIDVMAMAIF